MKLWRLFTREPRTKPLVKPATGYPPEHATTDAIKRHIDQIRPPE
jgi:hypothetical protein